MADEVITSYRANLEYKAKDEDLIQAIDKAVKESSDFKSEIEKRAERNKTYWRFGTDIDTSKYHPKKSKTIINRIFTDVETAIPILSANTPTPTILSDADNNVKNNIQRGLELAYEVKYRMQQKLQCLTRHWFIFRIGVLKYRWDWQRGFVTENIIPKLVGFDKRARTMEDCEYWWEELEDTVENLKARFPKKEKEINNVVGSQATPKTKVKYLEFWGGNAEWVVWKLKQVILEKLKNPNYDYADEKNNIFKKPRFPYIILTVFNLQDDTSLYDSTSLIEEAAPAQDGVNQLEQQILDLNEGQKRVWVISGETMSEAKAQDLVNKTGDYLVYLDRKAPASGIGQVQSGKPDASLYNNLTHLLSEIDNIIGIHSTTRGERAQQETWGGRQLLMSSDYGRLDLIVRNVESVMEEWFNAYLHVLKVFQIEEEVLRSGSERIEIKPEEIPSDIYVTIKQGSTLPTDDMSKMKNAIQLAQSDMIDPLTLFEEMGYPNAEKRVQDLFAWLQLTGKIIQQAPAQPTAEEGGIPPEVASIDEQAARIEQVLKSPEFQALPNEQKQEFIQRSRQILETIKGGTV